MKERNILLLCLIILLIIVLIKGSSGRINNNNNEYESKRDDNSTIDHTSNSNRNKKLLSLFNIVSFPNSPCDGGSKNGTCYTTTECENRVGTNSGPCASGYGVCCTFTVRCGATSTENCTYFESTGNEVGACSMSICKSNTNICQLRLDFQTFIITGPSTNTLSVGKLIFNSLNAAAGIAVADTTQCLTDTFSVTNPGGLVPPVICGTNTGEHMYVDASDSCNDLIFQLGNTAVGAAAAAQQWSIKISQYSCDYTNRAPSGCTQYHYGPTGAGLIKSYNFDGGSHLASQNQNICVRRERGMCRICWAAAAAIDVMLSSKEAKAFTKGSLCCGDGGADGMKTNGYDCIQIPGAEKMTANKAMIVGHAQCGRSKGLVTADMGDIMTVCSRQTPFAIRFISDNYEVAMGDAFEAKMPDVGFKLHYVQDNCA